MKEGEWPLDYKKRRRDMLDSLNSIYYRFGIVHDKTLEEREEHLEYMERRKKSAEKFDAGNW